MDHLSNWIEIPVTNMKRAKGFYCELLKLEVYEMKLGDSDYAIFGRGRQVQHGMFGEGPGTCSQHGRGNYLSERGKRSLGGAFTGRKGRWKGFAEENLSFRASRQYRPFQGQRGQQDWLAQHGVNRRCHQTESRRQSRSEDRRCKWLSFSRWDRKGHA